MNLALWLLGISLIATGAQLCLPRGRSAFGRIMQEISLGARGVGIVSEPTTGPAWKSCALQHRIAKAEIEIWGSVQSWSVAQRLEVCSVVPLVADEDILDRIGLELYEEHRRQWETERRSLLSLPSTRAPRLKCGAIPGRWWHEDCEHCSKD